MSPTLVISTGGGVVAGAEGSGRGTYTKDRDSWFATLPPDSLLSFGMTRAKTQKPTSGSKDQVSLAGGESPGGAFGRLLPISLGGLLELVPRN